MTFYQSRQGFKKSEEVVFLEWAGRSAWQIVWFAIRRSRVQISPSPPFSFLVLTSESRTSAINVRMIEYVNAKTGVV